jgi:nucleoid-associated protein YgaU
MREGRARERNGKLRITPKSTNRRIAEDTMADDNNPYTQTHVVQSGDTLSKIAQKYYGDPALYDKIFQANRDLLKDPNKIFPGQKLKIP